MHWSTADIADAVVNGLRGRAEELDTEQAVYGLDTCDELALHPVIQEALREAGYGVWPEQRYPDDRAQARRSEGKRCDVVLTADALPLRDPRMAGTLFDQQPATDPTDAYWLEIKTVAQYETTGPFARYSAELMSAVTADIKKIYHDEQIVSGGLVLVLFTADQRTAEHDLAEWHRRCIDRGYPAAAPAIRGFALTDRIGNGWCAVAVFGIRGA